MMWGQAGMLAPTRLSARRSPASGAFLRRSGHEPVGTTGGIGRE
jgi:hypothetical protein